MKVLAITQNTFREAIRNKILYSVIMFSFLLVGVSAFFGSVSIVSQERVIKDFGLFSLSFFGAIITILSGVSLLNKELKQKTVYNIISKPVERWQFIIGKHLGLSLTVSVLVSLMGVGLIAFVAFFEGKVDWLLFQGVLFVLLEVFVISAVTMFFSSMVVTTTLTGIFTAAFFIAGRSISYFTKFVESAENSNQALAGVVKVFDWVVPDLSLFNINNSIVYGQSSTIDHFLYALVYCLSYSTVALVLATLIFNKRELV